MASKNVKGGSYVTSIYFKHKGPSLEVWVYVDPAKLIAIGAITRFCQSSFRFCILFLYYNAQSELQQSSSSKIK